MADFDNRAIRATSVPDATDAGLKAYMLRVYNYMFLALLITGATAYATFTAAVTTDPAQSAGKFANGVMVTSFGALLFGSPIKWAVIFSPLVLVLLLNARIRTMSFATAQIAFWTFAAIMGVSLSSIFISYTYTSLAEVFFVTAAAFGGLSLWGYTTKTDLTGMGSFLFMGMIGVVAASVVDIWLKSDMLSFVYSVVGVVVFTGLTAYYTQKIKEMYVVSDDGSVAGRKAIIGALSLYIAFLNLFMSLLRLMGGRR
jgi:FtsH-binding integral membrane protein